MVKQNDRNSEEHRDKSFHDSLFVKVLIPIGSLLVAVMSFLTNIKEIPGWVSVVLGIFLAIASLSLLLPLLPVAKRLFVNWRSRVQIRRSAERFRPDVDRMIRRLQDQLSHSYTDTLLYGLWNYMNARDDKGCAILGNEFNQARGLSEWLSLVSEGGSRWNEVPIKTTLKGRVQDFVFVAEALDLAVIHYVSVCQSIENRLRGVLLDTERRVGEELAKQLKQAWNVGRESLGRFVHDWGKMGQEINDCIGFRVCVGNYSQLRPIE